MLSDGKSGMTVASGKVTVEASSSGYESSRGSDFSNEERFVYLFVNLQAVLTGFGNL